MDREETQVKSDQGVTQDLPAPRATKEGKDSVLQGPEENRAMKEWLELMATRVTKEKWDAKDNKEQKGSLVKRVTLDRLVSPETEGKQETQDKMALMDLLATQV